MEENQRVLDQAVRRVAEILDLDDVILGRVVAQPNGAIDLVRILRSLERLFDDDHTARSWLRLSNTVLQGVPLELMQSDVTRVASYLEDRAARP